MKNILLALTLSLFCGAEVKEKTQEITYEGTWVTVNRKLDGNMTALVTNLGDNKWKGRFYGTWQGQRFSYNIEWTGPKNALQGTATIDGASYEWKGKMDHEPGAFDGEFTGSRYKGYFQLKKK